MCKGTTAKRHHNLPSYVSYVSRKEGKYCFFKASKQDYMENELEGEHWPEPACTNGQLMLEDCKQHQILFGSVFSFFFAICFFFFCNLITFNTTSHFILLSINLMFQSKLFEFQRSTENSASCNYRSDQNYKKHNAIQHNSPPINYLKCFCSVN